MSEIEFHPLANLFPLLEGAEFDALTADISEYGLREAIVLHENKILDGRNRYRACVEAEIKPHFQNWDGKGTPQAFVVSKNLHRRHLNESQRGLIASKLANLRDGQNRQFLLGESKQDILSQSEAAELLNVGRKTVQDARIVIERGTPEEIKAAKVLG